MDKNNIISSYIISKYHHKDYYMNGNIDFGYNCIDYILKGSMQIFRNGKVFHAKSGDLLFFPHHSIHHAVVEGNPEISFYSISYDFFSSEFDYEFNILHQYPREIFDKMYDTYESNQKASIGYLYLLLSDLCPRFVRPPVTLPVEPAIKYIESNYNSNISMLHLASMCNMSLSSFFSHFKSATGISPIKYKNAIAVQYAQCMLVNTDYSIEEITSQMGFSSTNYFRRVFISITGQSPRNFRKSHRS